MVALTDTQYRSIIQTLLHGFEDSRPNPRVAAILTAEANLGMRVGDILRLHMADIVRDGNRYRLNMVEEKTGKQRKFTVPDEVYGFLRQYADAHRIPDTDLLFPISVRQVQHHLKLVCDHLGYENISTHSFRKWYATSIYNDNGHDIVLVQRLLQHSSPMVTRRYIGVSDEQMEQAIARHVNIISA
jgi:integrase